MEPNSRIFFNSVNYCAFRSDRSITVKDKRGTDSISSRKSSSLYVSPKMKKKLCNYDYR